TLLSMRLRRSVTISMSNFCSLISLHIFLYGVSVDVPSESSSTAAVDRLVFCPWAGHHGDLSRVWHEPSHPLPLAGPLRGRSTEAPPLPSAAHQATPYVVDV